MKIKCPCCKHDWKATKKDVLYDRHIGDLFVGYNYSDQDIIICPKCHVLFIGEINEISQS